MKKILIPATAFVAGFASGMFITNSRPPHSTPYYSTITDTIVIHDTLRVNTARSESMSRPGGTFTLPVTYSIASPALDSAISAPAVITPGGDSVRLAKEVKVYSDSSFRAVVSGVSPSLDSLTLYPSTRIVHRTATPDRPSRWGLGLTLGAAATPGGISPALTLGITYRLL